ncbi:MAG: hypothetical protein ACPIOQ_79460 [Promethearchaeia archaeon]
MVHAARHEVGAQRRAGSGRLPKVGAGGAQRAEAADGTPAREDIPALCRAYTLGD